MTDHKSRRIYLLPVLLILGVLTILAMLRLAVWQLDRAEYKNALLEQRIALSNYPEVDVDTIVKQLGAQALIDQRYRSVTANGAYLKDEPLFLDGRVHNSRVGYDVYSLFKTETGKLVLVDRGWVYAGASRTDLPKVKQPESGGAIIGRLNNLAAAPPMWNERYPSHDGQVWQYFPYDDLAAQYGQNLLPMVVELRPQSETSDELKIEWTAIDASGVAMHKGYAFQWFAMAAAFLIACIVLFVKSRKKVVKSRKQD